MVVEYLEKIRENFEEEKICITSEINEIKKKLKENIEIKKILEENNDPNFEAFTPRQVNGFNKRKIEELDIEQNNLENEVKILKNKLTIIDDNLEEVCNVIKVEKEKNMLLKELGCESCE